MPLPQLPVVGLDDVNHRRRSRETINDILTHQFDDSRVRTPAEIAAGVTPVNYAYPPGDVRRYGAKCDGVTDDTAAINAGANAVRQAYANGGGANFLSFPGPGPCLVSGSLDFSTIDVYGYGEWKHIQATSAQFDVITSTGSMKLNNLRVDGGWNGVTAGLSGDILALKAVSPAHPYQVQIFNCIFINAKKRHIYIERGGYTAIYGTFCLAAGLHSLECFGLSTDQCTTVRTYGSCTFSVAPNGYGIKLTECANCTFRDAILENTSGIQLNGTNNRSITFDGCYQEATTGGAFITDNGSGIGLVIRSCFGGNATVPFLTNWQDVYFQGNSNLAESAVPFSNRIVTNDSGQVTTATHGALSVTATSISLSPGTWIITGTMQFADAGAASLQDASFVLTTDVTNNGTASSTAGAFEVGTDRVYVVPSGAFSSTVRLKAATIYQNITSAAVTFYMRAFLNNAAGTIAYRGEINAVKFQ